MSKNPYGFEPSFLDETAQEASKRKRTPPLKEGPIKRIKRSMVFITLQHFLEKPVINK